MEMNGGSTASCLARTLCVPVFPCIFKIRCGSKEAFRLPEKHGITSVVRWNLGPVTFGVDFSAPKLYFLGMNREETVTASSNGRTQNYKVDSGSNCYRQTRPIHLRPVIQKRVGRLVEISSMNPTQGKCRRSRAPRQNNVDLLMGLLGGAVFHHGEVPDNSPLALINNGAFPLLNGLFFRP